MTNDVRTAGWNAQLSGIARSDNPHAAGSQEFRDWHEGHDQAGAASVVPLEMRLPINIGRTQADQ